MNIDVENIYNKKQKIGDRYMKLLIINILQQQNYFQQNF